MTRQNTALLPARACRADRVAPLRAETAHATMRVLTTPLLAIGSKRSSAVLTPGCSFVAAPAYDGEAAPPGLGQLEAEARLPAMAGRAGAHRS